MLLFSAFVRILIAQEVYQDMIYLKNGDIVKGVLVNEVLNISATIVNLEGDTLTFKMDDIRKLTREDILRNNISSKDKWLKPGYEFAIEAARAIAVGDFGIDYFQVDLVNGIRLNSYVYAGFGLGLTHINDPEYNFYLKPKIIVPVYLDLRINYPLSKRFSPYLAFDFGGSLSKERNHIEDKYFTDMIGVFLKTSLGMHIRIMKSISLNLAAGYRSQKMPFTHILYPERNANGIHTDLNFSNSVNIITGITF